MEVGKRNSQSRRCKEQSIMERGPFIMDAAQSEMEFGRETGTVGPGRVGSGRVGRPLRSKGAGGGGFGGRLLSTPAHVGELIQVIRRQFQVIRRQCRLRRMIDGSLIKGAACQSAEGASAGHPPKRFGAFDASSGTCERVGVAPLVIRPRDVDITT